MPSLPPPLWAELFYDGAFNDISRDVRATETVTVTRGLTAESSSAAEPTSCECVLDSRGYKYAPRAPLSDLFGKIGRNTGFRWGYKVGSPWAQMPGTAGSRLSTPDSAALAVTGDLDLRVDLAMESWETQCEVAGRYVSTGDNRSWGLLVGGTGQLSFMWSPDGTIAARIVEFSTIPIVAYNGQRLALRVTLDVNNGSGGYELRFYTGRTVNDEEWHLLGSPITGGSTTSVFDGTAGIELGDLASLTDPGMTGNLYAFQLRNGINGTPVVNMAVATGSPGGTSFTGRTGETWTVQGAVTLTNRHVRMAGEVPAWPATRDLSGNDNVVSINPSGVTRRMDAGNKPTDSALLRYIRVHEPLECWPLTDGIDTSGAKSLVGGRDMTYYLDTGFAGDQPVRQGGKLREWVEDVLALKAETIGVLSGGCRNSTSAAAAWSVDFFLGGGGEVSNGTIEINDRGAGTDTDFRYRMQLSYDAVANSITVIRSSFGETTSSGSVLTTVNNANIFDDRGHHIRVTIDPLASTTDWAIYVDGVQRASGNMTSIVFKAVRDIRLNWALVAGGGFSSADLSVGYITYWDGSGPTAGQMYDAFTGFQGERSGDRIVRLAEEAGYTASVAGETVFQQRMGIQSSKKLLELMNDAARTNFGYLLDARDRIEVIHRGQSTLWNQPPAVTLDFKAGLISAPFRPDDGDKLTENDVSVKREYGSVPAREVLETGTMSVLAPEDGGVGRYDKDYTYSVQTDAQARQVAGMRVHLGTYNGIRYTRVTLDLANPRVFQMIDDILRLDVGDKLRLTRVPDDHGPDDVDVLINGYTEEVGPDVWKITFNCVPGEPWTAGVVGSTTYGRADTAGCEVKEALDASETDVDVFTTAIARWIDSPTYASEFPFDVRSGGEVMRVTACDSAIRDTFTRSVSDSWGTATVGGTWSTSGGSGTDYDVNGTLGTHSMTSVNVSRYSVIPAPSADVDVIVSVATSALATGASHLVGPVARYLDGNNSYYARLAFNTSATCTLVLQKRVGGTQSDLTSVTVPGTHVANSLFKIRFQVIGTTLRAKAWLAIDPEPVAWQVSATDGDLTAAGSIGMRSILASGNTNTLPVTVFYDNFALLNPQTLTVTRGINGITKSHSSGQPISLAHPVYVAM
ncbi:hypothetical protein ACFVZZ_18700 [Streptomyces chartreusis]|uniref:hypothetical protein n=1 Tax=Streptomyces chartreusis TaxID=1969 RepID=UPI0036DCB657